MLQLKCYKATKYYCDHWLNGITILQVTKLNATVDEHLYVLKNKTNMCHKL